MKPIRCASKLSSLQTASLVRQSRFADIAEEERIEGREAGESRTGLNIISEA